MLAQPRSGYARIPYNQRCTVRRGNERITGALCNISVLGVYVTLPTVPEVGESLTIEFLLPGHEVPVEAAGTVTWQNLEEPQSVHSLPPGCGLRFDEISSESQDEIRSLVDQYVGQPAGTADRRRIPFVQRCLLAVEETIHDAVICNLSVMGVYVTLEAVPDTGEHVLVSFLLPGEPAPLRCAATVTWQNLEPPQTIDGLPPGCGLRFDDLQAGDRERIERVIAEHSALER
jgi:Tfp pilus assembly protein PilZ